MSAFDELFHGMCQGRDWGQMGDTESVRSLLGRVYDERYHKASHHKDRFQLRVNLQKKDDSASYAGWITAENPTSGPYQGTSFVWFPGVGGSVAVLAGRYAPQIVSFSSSSSRSDPWNPLLGAPGPTPWPLTDSPGLRQPPPGRRVRVHRVRPAHCARSPR